MGKEGRKKEPEDLTTAVTQGRRAGLSIHSEVPPELTTYTGLRCSSNVHNNKAGKEKDMESRH